MRGGARHRITLERRSVVVNDLGTEQETWAPVARVPAELVARKSVRDEHETAGTDGREEVTFLTRTIAGITIEDRVIWQGRAYELREVQPGGVVCHLFGWCGLVCEGAA